jgi:general secretion pathway protein M
MSAARLSNRAIGAVTVLLLLLLLSAGGGLAGFSILESKWIELDAQQTQLDNLKRRRPAAPSGNGADAAITVNPFLGEENFALAANALQKRVVGMIEETEGKLVTISVDPPVAGDEDLARRVSVQVTAELTNEALQKVLYQLESGVPFAFIDSFSVSRTEAREGAAKDETKEAPRLSVSMNITGYRRKGNR